MSEYASFVGEFRIELSAINFHIILVQMNGLIMDIASFSCVGFSTFKNKNVHEISQILLLTEWQAIVDISSPFSPW